MICQETLIGYDKPIYLIDLSLNEHKSNEIFQLGDKNPNKPPKKKQKKKKTVEETPIKKKRKKPRQKKTALS
ncbi:MAG: hypothetical protein JJU13_18925 [Balneolaceae bacterium]|nr:hypothetical protein [Balneolaceae bacterium]